MVSKGSQVAGSATSMIGAVLALFGFLLPWSSCGGNRWTGWDIVTLSAQGKTSNSNGIFLCLIPLLAIGVLGVAIATIPLALKKKPSFIKTIGPALLILLAVVACCPSGMFLINIQSARNDQPSFGFGGHIHVDYGFWVSMIGLLLIFLGGILGIAGSLLEKRKVVHES